MKNDSPAAETRRVVDAIYSTLVILCGAHESMRENFFQYMLRPDDRKEYRFSGHLAFGGKFRVSPERGWYVDYYPEDKLPGRDKLVAIVNAHLAAMKAGEIRIIAAAIRQDDKVWTGRRHNEIISDIHIATRISPVTGEQGFVTSTGEFVNRKRAGRIAIESGQICKLQFPRLGLDSSELDESLGV